MYGPRGGCLARKTIRLQAQSQEGIESLLSALVRWFDPDCDVVVEPFAPNDTDTWPEPKPGWNETPAHAVPKQTKQVMRRLSQSALGRLARRVGKSHGHFLRLMVSWNPDRIAGPVLAQIAVEWLEGRQAAGGAVAPALIAFYGPDGHLLDTLPVDVAR